MRVEKTLGQKASTFMQRSKPSMGETPALLTNTSRGFWKNFSAADQTCSHWALSVTSCSSNVQESSPKVWGKEGMSDCWMLSVVYKKMCYLLQCLADLSSCLVVFISEDNSAPALQNSPAKLLPKPSSSPCDQEVSVHSCLRSQRMMDWWWWGLLLVFIFVLSGLYEQQLIWLQHSAVTVISTSHLVLVTNNSPVTTWTGLSHRNQFYILDSAVDTQQLAGGDSQYFYWELCHGSVSAPFRINIIYFIYVGEVWCIYYSRNSR